MPLRHIISLSPIQQINNSMTDKQPGQIYQFADITVDVAQRRLSRQKQQLDINGRYFDALVLLLDNAGRLVSKETFMSEVWQGIAVTDEALTQCIRSLRRLLNDDARDPRFIETVPKHGYRFIGQLQLANDSSKEPGAMLAIGSVTLGAGLSGIVGGAALGALVAVVGHSPVTVIPVLTALTLFVALLGGAAVSFGAFIMARLHLSLWLNKVWLTTLGGALGGMAIGYLFCWSMTETFALMFGTGKLAITGGPEGLTVGAGAGLLIGVTRLISGSRAMLSVALVFTTLVVSIGLFGVEGKLMAQSLIGLGQLHQQSAIPLVQLGQWVNGFGNISVITFLINFVEVLLFYGGIMLALLMLPSIDQDSGDKSTKDLSTQ